MPDGGTLGAVLTATSLGVILVPIFFVWVLSRFSRRKQAGRGADAPMRPAADGAAE